MEDNIKKKPSRRRNGKGVIVEMTLNGDKNKDDDVYIYSEAEMTHTDNEYEIISSDGTSKHSLNFNAFYLKVTDEKKLSLIINYLMPIYLENNDTNSSITHNMVISQVKMPHVHSTCRMLSNRLTEKGGEIDALYDVNLPLDEPTSRRIHISVREDRRK